MTGPAPLFLFAPGAGAPSSSPWMVRWAALLGELGPVERFDYPYRRAGRRMPDRLPVLVGAHREALAAARRAHPGRRAVLVGKSMGGRVGCHLAVEVAGVGESPAGLCCLGYPLRPPGGGAARDAVLVALEAPVLFAQGTRDALCPLPELARVRARMRARSELLVVDGGDHSLELPRRGAAPDAQARSDRRVLDALAAFVATLG